MLDRIFKRGREFKRIRKTYTWLMGVLTDQELFKIHSVRVSPVLNPMEKTIEATNIQSQLLMNLRALQAEADRKMDEVK